ncbi:MAG: class I SAM-dependent methyltransferase [Acetobacteraceae bacterium]
MTDYPQYKDTKESVVVHYESAIASRISFVADTEIDGIVVNIQNPTTPVSVTILINGHVFRTDVACLLVDYRHFRFIGEKKFKAFSDNLKGAQIVAARFRYTVPDYAVSEQPTQISVRESISGEELFTETRTFREDFNRSRDAILRNRLIGQMYVSALGSSRVSFGGSFSVIADRCDLAVVSDAGKSIDAEISQQAVPAEFAQVPGVQTVRIVGSVEVDSQQDAVRVVDRNGAISISPGTSVFIPADCEAEFKTWRIPPDGQMRRVMGFADSLSYYFGGFSNFQIFDAALKEFTGRSIGEFKSILDWGCGAGRVSQHLVRRTQARVQGVDIDPENIAWCAANMPTGEFSAINALPPTKLASDSVDLIIGVSVFTHLDEATRMRGCRRYGACSARTASRC